MVERGATENALRLTVGGGGGLNEQLKVNQAFHVHTVRQIPNFNIHTHHTCWY